MHRFTFAIAALFILFGLMACSGSKKSGETVVPFENNQLQEQVENLQKQIKDNPNTLEYRRQLASLYQQNGREMDALQVLERGFAIDPNDAESKFLYAEIAASLGDNLKAFRAYKDVLQSSDGDAYLDRVAPKFADAFPLTKLISTDANEAFGTFSASGDKVVYQSDQNGNWDIFEYDIASTNITQLTNSPAHEENPVISPDGKEIIYTSTVEDHRDVDYNQKLRDIFVKDLDTGRERNLTTNGSNDWRPRYSSDGKLIVFVSERNDLRNVPFYEFHGDIFLMESDGKFQRALTKNSQNNGGACLAYGSTEENGVIYFDSNRSGAYEIYKTDMKGAKTSQITFNANSNDVSPDVSPRGDKITFFSDRDGNYEIYLMNNDGSAVQRLTSNVSDDLNPVFSPDGTRIIFHSNRGGNFDIYMLDLTKEKSTPALYEVISRIDKAIESLL
ncbi:MAG: hypothetical protein AB7W47_02390 [Calditrichaceae bacterium]